MSKICNHSSILTLQVAPNFDPKVPLVATISLICSICVTFRVLKLHERTSRAFLIHCEVLIITDVELEVLHHSVFVLVNLVIDICYSF